MAEEKNVITKKLFREWLTGYLMGPWPTDEEEFRKFMEEGKNAQEQAKGIIRFLDEYDCFSKDMKDE